MNIFLYNIEWSSFSLFIIIKEQFLSMTTIAMTIKQNIQKQNDDLIISLLFRVKITSKKLGKIIKTFLSRET